MQIQHIETRFQPKAGFLLTHRLRYFGQDLCKQSCSKFSLSLSEVAEKQTPAARKKQGDFWAKN